MYNLGDDSELDRLSREAAGRYESPGNANWQALSEELDKVMPEEKKKRRFLFWWLLPGLLAGGAITYGIIKRDDNNTASIEKNIPAVSTDKSTEQVTTANNNPTNESGLSRTDKNATVPPEKTVTFAPSQVKGNTVPLLNKGKNSVTLLSSKKANNNSDPNKAKSAATSTDRVETGSLPVQSAVITPETSKAVEQPMVIKEQKSVTSESNQAGGGQVDSKTALDLFNQKGKVFNMKPTISYIDKKIEDKPTDAPEFQSIDGNQNKSIEIKPRGHWSFGLLTGIDKSTVKLKYGYAPGFNLGLEIAYHFNDKWAVRAGGIFTQKNYKLAGEDFTAPKGTPISYYKLDQVEGSCHMWEVPLLVSYTISSKGKKAVTLNTGLSSYFMTHEDYDYYYVYNGTPTYRSASYNSADQHILSIVHLSAGFENRLSKTMSLQIEPYAKIPLGGVGFGNIQLSSFGVNFSVQYRQPHKK